MTDDERKVHELLTAFAQWPRLPGKWVLGRIGSYAGQWPDDWERGQIIQRELPQFRVPYNTECEMGAGFWDRITGGAWRDHEPLPTPPEDATP